MLKRIVIISLIVSLLAGAGIFYLNSFFLPAKIHNLVVTKLQQATQKKATLRAVKFSLFKGLVLKELALSDDTRQIISAKEVSLGFLLLPILQKKLIIPSLKLRGVEIFLQRKSDGTINLQNLFASAPAPSGGGNGLNVIILRAALSAGRLVFQDDNLTPPLRKIIEGIELTASFSLPHSLKFRLRSAMVAGSGATLEGEGSCNLVGPEVVAKFNIAGLTHDEFDAYYRNSGVTFPQGKIDALLDIRYRDKVVNASCLVSGDNLLFKKDKLSLNLNAQMQFNFIYNLKDKTPGYNGELFLTKSSILGLEFIGEVLNLEGKLNFRGPQVSAKEMTATILTLPVKIDFSISDIRNPLLNASVSSGRLDIPQVKAILQDKLGLKFPAEVKGDAQFTATLQSSLPPQGRHPLITAYLDLNNAELNFTKGGYLIEAINGRLELTPQEVKWQGLNFKFNDNDFITSGSLTDIRSPRAQFKLSSGDLTLEANLSYRNGMIKLAQARGKYFSSNFFLKGEIWPADKAGIEADLEGSLALRLENLEKIFTKFKPQIQRIRPAGIAQANLKFKGNLKDMKGCFIQALVTSDSLSAYGLKSGKLNLNYSQEDSLGKLAVEDMDLYGGRVNLDGKINFNSPNLPYTLNADIRGLRIERLKLDTPSKDKDLAGALDAQLKLNGFSNYLDKLSGAGTIFITDGRLWQLNLFKGLGEIIFVKDFASIVFSEGSCSFSLQNKTVSTENLKLKSVLAEISGCGKVGFDGSLEGMLNVHVNDDNAPLSGTLKDIFTVVVGQAGRFGVIYVSGTVSEPKFKFKTAVGDILKSIKDTFFKNLPYPSP